MPRFLTRFSFAVCTGALTLAFAGCPTGPADGPEGCEEGEVEHPYTGDCVADCSTDDSVCEGATPVCLGSGGADGGTTDGDSIFAGLCGCDENSCGAGEVCNPIAGVCVAPCDPFEGGDADAGEFVDCPEIDGEAWACYNHPAADDYVCQPPCADSEDCTDGDYPVCDDGFCVAFCDSADPLRLLCADNDCNVGTGLCGGPNACMGNDDCGNLVCDLASGDCVACEENADCGDMVCDLGTGECVGCEEQADCGDGSDCDLVSGECFEVCSTIGVDPLCEDEEVCIDGDPVNFCEAECIDEDCIADTDGPFLCQYDTLDADFNLCVAPDDATGWCAAGATHARDAGGPVIQWVQFDMEGAACGNNGVVTFYTARVYTTVGLPASLYTAGVTYLEDDGTPQLTYSDGPGTATHPSAEPVMGMDDYYDVHFTLCEPKDDEALAIYIDDNTGGTQLSSNAICFVSGLSTE